MILADLTMNSARAKVVDFSIPILTSKLGVFHRTAGDDQADGTSSSNSSFSSIFKTMSPSVWISFVILLGIYLGAIAFSEKKFGNNKQQLGNSSGGRPTISQPRSGIMAMSLAAASTATGGSNNRNCQRYN
jgi:hypothetical protein